MIEELGQLRVQKRTIKPNEKHMITVKVKRTLNVDPEDDTGKEFAHITYECNYYGQIASILKEGDIVKIVLHVFIEGMPTDSFDTKVVLFENDIVAIDNPAGVFDLMSTDFIRIYLPSAFMENETVYKQRGFKYAIGERLIDEDEPCEFHKRSTYAMLTAGISPFSEFRGQFKFNSDKTCLKKNMLNGKKLICKRTPYKIWTGFSEEPTYDGVFITNLSLTGIPYMYVQVDNELIRINMGDIVKMEYASIVNDGRAFSIKKLTVDCERPPFSKKTVKGKLVGIRYNENRSNDLIIEEDSGVITDIEITDIVNINRSR